MDSEIHTQI